MQLKQHIFRAFLLVIPMVIGLSFSVQAMEQAPFDKALRVHKSQFKKNLKNLEFKDTRGNHLAHYAVAIRDMKLLNKLALEEGYYSKEDTRNNYGANLLHTAIYYEWLKPSKTKELNRLYLIDKLLCQNNFNPEQTVKIGDQEYTAVELVKTLKNQISIDVLDDMYSFSK